MADGEGATLSTGRGPVLLAVTWTWAGIATVLYFTRAITASKATGDLRGIFGIRWDFFWVTVAYVNGIAAETFITISVVYGTGNHQNLLSPHQAVTGAFWSWIGQICCIFTLVWGRFAVIAFLIALQGCTYKYWRYTLYVVGGAQFLINAIEVGLILNQCTPVQRLWDQSIPGECNLITICSKVGFLQGSIGSFADFFLALYPPAVIIGPLQQMNVGIKIGLCSIMGGGVFAGIAGIVKTIAIESITHTDDISFQTIDLLIWVLTEMWFIIIFGSLPTIRTILITAGRNITSTFSSASKSSSRKRSTFSRDRNWHGLGPDNRFEAKINSSGKASATDKSGLTESQDEVLDGGEQRRGIVILRETTVDVQHEALDEPWRDGYV